METPTRPRGVRGALQSAHIATVTVILFAYAVTIIGYVAQSRSEDKPLFGPPELALAIALGIVYLALSISGPPALRRFAGRYAVPVYFAIQTALVLAIMLLLIGSNGIWLITMPLVATAVTDLKGVWRWVIYGLSLLCLVIPIGLASSWDNALVAGLMFSPAIVFVVVFVRLNQSAEEAQADAERLAGELETANHRLAAYAVQAEEMATIQERNRVAREIHDNLGHYLTVVNVQVKAAQAVMDKDPSRARAALEKAQQLTEEGLAAVRQSVSSLRGSPLGSRPLPEAIESLAAETRASGLIVDLAVQGTARPLDPRVELTLFRAAQEGLTNVRKHANASRVDIALDYTRADEVRLCLRDNGVGERAGSDTGFGLIGLRERAGQLGGRVIAESLTAADGAGPGRSHGFRLQVDLPAPDDAPPARE